MSMGSGKTHQETRDSQRGACMKRWLIILALAAVFFTVGCQEKEKPEPDDLEAVLSAAGSLRIALPDTINITAQDTTFYVKWAK